MQRQTGKIAGPAAPRLSPQYRPPPRLPDQPSAPARASSRPTATRAGYASVQAQRGTAGRSLSIGIRPTSTRPTATRAGYVASRAHRPRVNLAPLTGFAPVGALIVRRLTAKASPANALAEWKAAQRAARRQMRLTGQALQQAAQATTQAASKLVPRRPDSPGKLFDGKEILDGGGRLVGHWRYRGGQFQPDYFA